MKTTIVEITTETYIKHLKKYLTPDQKKKKIADEGKKKIVMGKYWKYKNHEVMMIISHAIARLLA